MQLLHFSIQIERGWSWLTQILSEMNKDLKKLLQATLELASSSMQKSKEKFNTEKKELMLKLIEICMCMCNVYRLVKDQSSTYMVQVARLTKLFLSLLKA